MKNKTSKKAENPPLNKGDVMPSLFAEELIKWLQEKGFLNDRGWDKKGELGMKFYSFVKGNYRFEIKLGWDKRFDWYEPILINFLDCEKEWWGEPMNCLMWMGQNNLHTFKKPFSRSMFDAICEQYGI